jgi:hypothetical protein
MPRLPMNLSLDGLSVEVVGLLDTGAAVSVLPYRVGLALGAVWADQTVPVSLVGSLGQFEARALITTASHPQITKEAGIRLAFAWTQSENVPVIFGQMNFFMEFDVCFYRAQGAFEVNVKASEG